MPFALGSEAETPEIRVVRATLGEPAFLSLDYVSFEGDDIPGWRDIDNDGNSGDGEVYVDHHSKTLRYARTKEIREVQEKHSAGMAKADKLKASGDRKEDNINSSQHFDGVDAAADDEEEDETERNNRRPRLLSEVDERLDHAYTSLIQTTATSPTLHKAVEAGWKFREHMRKAELRGNENIPEMAFVEVQAYVDTEHMAGVSAGMLLGAIIEGMAPNAIKQADNKMENLIHQHLIPQLTDQVDGSECPASFLEVEEEERRSYGAEPAPSALLEAVSSVRAAAAESKCSGKGVSGKAKGPGDLAIAIAEDLVLAAPSIVDQASTIFANLAGSEIHQSLSESCSTPLIRDIPKAVAKLLTSALSMTIPEIVPPVLRRLLPPYLRKTMVQNILNLVTRSVTHTLTHTMQMTLLRSPLYERYCYLCHYFQEHCKECHEGNDQKRQYVQSYYAHFYSSYYSDYYSLYFWKKMLVEEMQALMGEGQ